MFTPLKSWFRTGNSQIDTEKHRETIQKVEQHFTRIAEVAAKYARTVEEMSRNIDNFPDAVDECVRELEEPKIVRDFNRVHKSIRSVNKFRQIVANSMQRRTEDVLLIYKKKCADMTQKIKDAEALVKMEKKELKKLEKLKAKHPDLESTIKAAEEKLERAKGISAGSKKMLDNMMRTFERKKLLNLKRTTMGIICDEMRFHGFALEMYTKAYKSIERSGGLVGWEQKIRVDGGQVYEVLLPEDSPRHSQRENSKDQSDEGPLSLSDLG